MILLETLAEDPQLAPAFEEYLICKVYLDQLYDDHRPETTTMRSVVRTQIKSIGRRIATVARGAYPGLDAETISRAAEIILQRQPVGRDYYLAKLPQ